MLFSSATVLLICFAKLGFFVFLAMHAIAICSDRRHLCLNCLLQLLLRTKVGFIFTDSEV